MLRSIRLLDALRVAEASGIHRLSRLAAGLLEQVRDVTEKMMRLSVSSRLYDEQVDEIVRTMCAGESWDESLLTFAAHPPVTGDLHANEALVRHRHQVSPLEALLPPLLYSPEGLPYLLGDDEAARFDIELTSVEQQNLQQLLRPMASALIQGLHGQVPPPGSVLAGYLAQWPGSVGQAPRLADVLLRFWAGDYDGAGFMAVPLVEAIARGLLDGNGTYVSQRQETPGQFPTLGGLLPLLAEDLHLDESRARYLRTVLVYAGRMNLRNLLAHGYVARLNAQVAALLIHCALMMSLLDPDAAKSEPSPARSDGPHAAGATNTSIPADEQETRP